MTIEYDQFFLEDLNTMNFFVGFRTRRAMSLQIRVAILGERVAVRKT